MKKIKTFLQTHTTPHAKVDVVPPNLEHVLFSFQIKFIESQNADSRLYKENLNNSINAYLSPWAFEQQENIDFQDKIYTSSIIKLIEEQPFVDYLFDFKAKHYDDDISDIAKSNTKFKSMDTIEPLTDYSLFLPGKHQIAETKKVCCT